jgi:hypothetical protein
MKPLLLTLLIALLIGGGGRSVVAAEAPDAVPSTAEILKNIAKSKAEVLKQLTRVMGEVDRNKRSHLLWAFTPGQVSTIFAPKCGDAERDILLAYVGEVVSRQDAKATDDEMTRWNAFIFALIPARKSLLDQGALPRADWFNSGLSLLLTVQRQMAGLMRFQPQPAIVDQDLFPVTNPDALLASSVFYPATTGPYLARTLLATRDAARWQWQIHHLRELDRLHQHLTKSLSAKPTQTEQDVLAQVMREFTVPDFQKVGR